MRNPTRILLLTAAIAMGAPATASAVVAVPADVPYPIDPITMVGGIWEDHRSMGVSFGAWGNDPIDFTFQWQRCDAAGNRCRSIRKATAPGRVSTSADVGHRLRVLVTGWNASGPSVPAASDLTPVIQPSPPMQ